MTEAERNKRMRFALYLMFGASVVGIVLFWAIQALFGAPVFAFAALAFATMAGAAHYIYQTHKLNPKDKP